MLRNNRLKHSLRERACSGAWLFSGNASAAEILALEGFDALIIDQEHSPCSIESTVAQMRAIGAAGGPTALVRVPDLQPVWIKLALDAGAEGIIAPRIETAAEARALVSACQYPPLGMRGAHYTVSRAAHWGVRAQDYAERYERELLIIAMIESHAGLRAASEIAAVEGIDMLFFGPLDYTADIGRMGHFDDTRVSEAIDSLASAVRGSGKWLGCTVLPSFTAADLVARDYRFVTAGSDVGFLQSGARAALASAGQLPRRR